MKVAIPIRNGRISPVFDVAVRLVVVEFKDGVQSGRDEFTIRESGAEVRAALLRELGVSTLICGAISNQAARVIEGCGVKLMPWLVGEIDDVIEAWCSDSLESAGFIMPGCGQGRRSGCRNEKRDKAGAGRHRGGGRRKRE